jgi:hypothetical protein
LFILFGTLFPIKFFKTYNNSFPSISYLTARNGIVQKLTLPDPADEHAGPTVNTLLDFLNAFWQKANTSGDLIR